MKGKCLCGQVVFEISGKLSNIFQCHCSLCQKATGSSSCSSMITAVENVSWLSGEEKISSFTKECGFRSDFCSECGSPVPNIMNIAHYMWIPAGLLEDNPDKTIAAHIHLDSKASWEKSIVDCKNYPGGPDNIKEFIELIEKL